MTPWFIPASHPTAVWEEKILAHHDDIEAWFAQQWTQHEAPLYCSVDLRHSGFKLAVVDTNLFPAGFNNLSESMAPLATEAFTTTLARLKAPRKELLILPENHSRNLYYLQNIHRLQQILNAAGWTVKVASLDASIDSLKHFPLPDGNTLEIEPLLRQGQRLGSKGFDPSVIVLNNDLSAGIPAVLQNLGGQIVLPPPALGWHQRRKSQHFQHYEIVASALANLLELDPWHFTPYFNTVAGIDFHQRQGEQALADSVSDILNKTRAKYREHSITSPVYAVIKADAGTYGMGVMMVSDAQEIINLNRKTRNKMSVIKEGQNVNQVIVQEGIPTIEKVSHGSDSAVAETAVYMVGRDVVGSFHRYHLERDNDDNLNTPGAHFAPLPFANTQQPLAPAPQNTFYPYNTIARLGLLAAAYEAKALSNVKT